MALHSGLREFVALLNAKGVEYLIVGAHALAHHGRPRYTGDLDVFFRPSVENAGKLERLLHDFGFSDLGPKDSDFLEEGSVIQLGVGLNRVDLFNTLTGVSFDAARAGRVAVELSGVPVQIIGRDEFIRNKRALGRAKDLADIEMLEDVDL